VKELVEKLVSEIKKMSLDEQRQELMMTAPEMLEASSVAAEESRNLSELSNVDKWPKVVMRLAPFPSGPLHIGNARMVVLNDYYVKRYNGELLLVFDDTIGSAEKVVEPDAFEMIPEGLEYLGVEWHRTVYKSDRLELFYKYAVDLIERNEAYVCDCDAEVWRKEHKAKEKACKCSILSVEDNLARWEKMLDGTYPERGAAVRLRTGMADPDPAMRDHVILRISESEHPRVGTRYRVWPLLEYSWGIDDHELVVTHIIRGKDLVKEGKIEQHIWNIYDWQHPELIYYGRLKFQDAKLSKSKSRREVLEGVYTGWDDPRTWSMQSLEKRGIHPDAVRKAMLDLGLSVVDISISMKTVYSENRKLQDASAPRMFFVEAPVWVELTGLPPEIQEAEAPVHPDFPDRGVRQIPLGRSSDAAVPFVAGISERDLKRLTKGEIFRLKDLANFTLKKGRRPEATFHSVEVDNVRTVGGSIIHWIPRETAVPVEVTMIDGAVVTGHGEPSIKNIESGTFLQFERVGFACVFDVGDPVRVAFAHK
ncbi:MAG: glutamate--tRNA ligase, partial [Candidatus Thorarchaeota archaeon]